ncbi:ribonuclease P protein component [Gammaproteobacteria bacterium]|nr:ribonuclease P protein component [Gammaproteobacteria bacterium]
MTYSKKNILNNKKDFNFVFKSSNKISHKYLTVIYNNSPSLINKLGIIVKKRFIKKAVDRNKIKRIIRESFRYQSEKMKGKFIIVIIRNKCNELSKLNLRKGIDELWEKLKTQ